MSLTFAEHAIPGIVIPDQVGEGVVGSFVPDLSRLDEADAGLRPNGIAEQCCDREKRDDESIQDITSKSESREKAEAHSPER
jgi:hypothetical protein